MKNKWKFYLKKFDSNKKNLTISIILTIIQPLILLPIVLLVRYIFDNIIPNKEINKVIYIGIGIIFLYIVNNSVSLFSHFLSLQAIKCAILNLREEILKKFYTFPRSYYSNTDRIKLHTIIVQDTQRVDIGSNALISLFLPSVIISIAFFCILIYIDWKLVLVLVCFFPIIIIYNRVISKQLKNWTYKSHRVFESFSKGLLFVLQLMDLTRLRSAEQYEINRQIDQFNALRNVSMFNAWLIGAYQMIHNTLIAFSGVIILIFGSIAVVEGNITLGEFLSFYVAMGMMRVHLSKIINSIPKIIEGNESLTTLYNLYNERHNRPYNGKYKIEFNGRITLDAVCFSYDRNKLLNNINLNIAPGSYTLIHGPNGCGKSTIANLILGFYRPQGGSLFAEAYNYDRLDINHLRKSIGVVPQDPIVFSGSIWENITYGYPDIDRSIVEEATKNANILEFIEQLPVGFETNIGDKGMLFSGGQRQSISIAHALLLKPKLLILDEPTNHLDEKAIKRLMINFKKLSFKPAILIISHNKLFFNQVDSVYIIKNKSLIHA